MFRQKNLAHTLWTRLGANLSKDEKLPLFRQGKNAKRRSVLRDEDYLLPLQQYVRENKFKIWMKTLTAHINEKILNGLGYAPSLRISERTTMRWLHSLDISLCEVQKHIYVDGYEREDEVKCFWNKFVSINNVCRHWRACMDMMRVSVFRRRWKSWVPWFGNTWRDHHFLLWRLKKLLVSHWWEAVRQETARTVN